MYPELLTPSLLLTTTPPTMCTLVLNPPPVRNPPPLKQALQVLINHLSLQKQTVPTATGTAICKLQRSVSIPVIHCRLLH